MQPSMAQWEKLALAGLYREDRGAFVMARQVSVNQQWTPMEAEALGLLESIKWACSLDITHAVFEMDCKGVVDKLDKTHHANTARLL